MPASNETALAAASTIAHYERAAEAFWQGTKDHDVSQNVQALLGSIQASPPWSILDLGCGPGRDLITFRDLGHRVVGLDGAASFVRMAREHSGCEVYHQNFLELDLPEATFDGIFANAVLFHVPKPELARVLNELRLSLKEGGVLFSSNPHGPDVEQSRGERYGCYLCWETWRDLLLGVGFKEVQHYFRPAGLPRDQQPWLASVWRR